MNDSFSDRLSLRRKLKINHIRQGELEKEATTATLDENQTIKD